MSKQKAQDTPHIFPAPPPDCPLPLRGELCFGFSQKCLFSSLTLGFGEPPLRRNRSSWKRRDLHTQPEDYRVGSHPPLPILPEPGVMLG